MTGDVILSSSQVLSLLGFAVKGVLSFEKFALHGHSGIESRICWNPAWVAILSLRNKWRMASRPRQDRVQVNSSYVDELVRIEDAKASIVELNDLFTSETA